MHAGFEARVPPSRGPRSVCAPKSFNVLRYFVENAGRLISKEELAGAVWCDSPVSDETLTRCLSDVRTAIGDRGQEMP